MGCVYIQNIRIVHLFFNFALSFKLRREMSTLDRCDTLSNLVKSLVLCKFCARRTHFSFLTQFFVILNKLCMYFWKEHIHILRCIRYPDINEKILFSSKWLIIKHWADERESFYIFLPIQPTYIMHYSIKQYTHTHTAGKIEDKLNIPPYI